jgi:putative endonuclease
VVDVRPEQQSGTAAAELGRWGEQRAAEHLVAAGMEVLDRNWRCRDGELDLVTREQDGTVVFVEVKTRAGTGFGQPVEAVGWRKAQRLRRLACQWLAAHPVPRSGLRFDVVGIVRRPGEVARVEHVRDVF